MSGTTSGTWTADGACVPAARTLVREALRGCAPELVDDAALVVTELVANVVLHVGGDVTVDVVTTPGEVLLEVGDSSAVPPLLRSFSATSSTGRGMRLVHSLAAEHGVRPRAGGGKTVWVRMTEATSTRSDDELIASFTDVDWLAELDDAAPTGTTSWTSAA